MGIEDVADPYELAGEESIDERLNKMDNALEHLVNLCEKNAKWRRVYMLKYQQNLSYEELAKAEKVSQRSAKYIVRNITAKLKMILKGVRNGNKN